MIAPFPTSSGRRMLLATWYSDDEERIEALLVTHQPIVAERYALGWIVLEHLRQRRQLPDDVLAYDFEFPSRQEERRLVGGRFSYRISIRRTVAARGAA